MHYGPDLKVKVNMHKYVCGQTELSPSSQELGSAFVYIFNKSKVELCDLDLDLLEKYMNKNQRKDFQQHKNIQIEIPVSLLVRIYKHPMSYYNDWLDNGS